MAKEQFISIDEFLGAGRETYTWTVPSLGKAVELKRLTHGDVKALNEKWRAAGQMITDELQDEIVAMGLVRPAVTVEQLNGMVGGQRAIGELYTQVASECGFIVVLPAPARQDAGAPAAAERPVADAGDDAVPLA